MLALKELRLSNEEKVTNSTALLAGTGSTSSSYNSPSGCRLTSGSIQTGSFQLKKTGGGGGKKKWKGKQANDSFQSQPHPTSPWICFSLGTGAYANAAEQQPAS